MKYGLSLKYLPKEFFYNSPDPVSMLYIADAVSIDKMRKAYAHMLWRVIYYSTTQHYFFDLFLNEKEEVNDVKIGAEKRRGDDKYLMKILIQITNTNKEEIESRQRYKHI